MKIFIRNKPRKNQNPYITAKLIPGIICNGYVLSDGTACLSEQTGKQYRLPSEAEWGYAARAGTETKYWWGNEIGGNQANCNGCGSQWDNKQTAPVGYFKPNQFDLYDTAGNVREWCSDGWHYNYNNAPIDGSAWKNDNKNRVLRGGSWSNSFTYSRSAFNYSQKACDFFWIFGIFNATHNPNGVKRE